MNDRIITDEFEMGYIRFGKGTKTLVILPGLSVQSVLSAAPAIEKQYEIFAEDFTVYLFDRRSDLPDEYSVYDMADDTAKAMKELNLSGVCLFGVSQGGMIAELLAIRYPELVGKAVFASTACHLNHIESSALEDWIRFANEGKANELYLAFGEKVYSAEVFEQYRNIFSEMAKTVTEDELKRFSILAGGTKGFDVKNELSNIRCPVLAIGDKTDAVFAGV